MQMCVCAERPYGHSSQPVWQFDTLLLNIMNSYQCLQQLCIELVIAPLRNGETHAMFNVQ